DKPEYQVLSGEFDEKSNLNLARIVPVYQLVDGLSIKTLRRAIYNAIEQFYDSIQNVIPEYIRQRQVLMERREAIKQIHFPDDEDKMGNARFTLVFEEFFLLQLQLALTRETNSRRIKSIPLKI